MNTSPELSIAEQQTGESADIAAPATFDERPDEGRRRRGRGRHGEHRRSERGGHSRRRRGRGDIRPALLLLIADEPRHGYELMLAIGERTDGQWQPSPGSVYPALQQLQDEGLIIVTADDHNRGVAQLTAAGEEYVADNADELQSVWTSDSRTGSRTQTRAKMHGLGLALKQVQAVGTAAQIAQAGEVIDEAQRKVYAILAAEPTDVQ